ncbi:28S ribosomal protein S22, mitochondrial [Tachysurus ichikawai]
MAALSAALLVFRHGLKTTDPRTVLGLKMLSSSLSAGKNTDQVPKAQFTDAEVQDILKRITGLDLNKVFRPIKQELKPPKYKLLTEAQLKEAVKKAEEEAQRLLQMPPVLPERQPISDVLCEDEILEGMDTAKYVFTDITYNIPHRERFIVVREPSGVLRKASWEERDRLIQVYFPREGRKLTASPIFKEENLKVVFGQNRHEEVLNYCLVQFEPDSADFKRVHTLTYEDIEQHGKYELLRSTCLFGGLVWFLVSSRRIDGLLLDMLQRERLQDAVDLVQLFKLIHPQSDVALKSKQATGIDLLKVYADCESQKPAIKLALQSYEQVTAANSL